MKWYYYVIVAIILIFVICIICRKQITFFIVAFTGKKRIQKKLYKACKINDFLILNDLYFPIGNQRYRYIDTLIFGNKFIYVVKEIKQAGDVKIDINDLKWRIIYGSSLTNIDNPLIENQHRIQRMLSIVPGLEKKDFKSIVVFTKTCNFDPINNNDFEFVLSENDVVAAIIEIEKHSDIEIIPSSEQEKYAKAFYKYGLQAEKEIKELHKKKHNNGDVDE